jgi:hypothetical protein
VELAYVILWRGQPGWREQPGAVVGPNMFSSGPQRRAHQRVVSFASGTISWEYDEGRRVLTILGREVALTTDNVVFVDRVDGVGGPPVFVGTTAVARQLPSFDVDLVRLTRGSSEVQRFVR